MPTQEREVLNRWAEYCSELYNHQLNCDPAVLDYPQANSENDSHSTICEEVEAAVTSLKKGKSAGIDIPGELIQAIRFGLQGYGQLNGPNILSSSYPKKETSSCVKTTTQLVWLTM